MATTDAYTEARTAVVARLARDRPRDWDYGAAVTEYCMGLTVHEAELFVGAVDLFDAVQAALDEGALS